MKSKSGFAAFLIRLFLLSAGTFMAVLAGLLLQQFLHSFEGFALSGFLLLGFMSSSAIFLFFGLVSSLRIDEAQQLIKVKRGWFFGENYRFIDFVGCKGLSVTSRYGSYRGFLIELRTGAQVQFTELDFVNFTDVRAFILSRLKRENSLKRSIWKIGSRKSAWRAAFFMLLIWGIILLKP